MCITRRSPVASALWLVQTLFSLAALFVVLDAQFIAVLQVLVYAAAIMVLFMCVAPMLHAVRLAFVSLPQSFGVAGQGFVFFVLAVAAAEAAVGLAIILAIYRHKQTVDLQDINLLKG